MTTIFLLARSHAAGETTVIAAFKLRASADHAKKVLDRWFQENPRPKFDELWDASRSNFHEGKLNKITCPYDPGHVEDFPLAVPAYTVMPVEQLGIVEFLDPFRRFAEYEDRALRARHVKPGQPPASEAK